MRIGIDLGGTKIEAIAIERDHRELARRRIPTPRHDYDATLAAIVRLVEDLERETGRRGTVGVGIPGTTSPATGVIKNANSTWLIGRPLHEDLAARLDRPVRLANDANCFTLSEATDGAAAGVHVAFGVIIGSGVGGGIAVDGRVLIGHNAVCGEWGHNPLPWPHPAEWPGAPCYCGRSGCIETFLSGPGLARDLQTVTGETLDPAAIVRRAGEGDPDAEAAVARYEDRMARALGSIINVLDPDVIVMGGGMSNIERLCTNVPRLWDPYVFSDRVETRLVRAMHGDSSGVRGAAWLWED